ncbi:sigma 54-interacting transcriptional regulator [Croceiramulus getboli]|nr:sigma 54-interacting transcriptional regulator [Flavobacteriaceae bacterium YJPT1-3]
MSNKKSKGAGIEIGNKAIDRLKEEMQFKEAVLSISKAVTEVKERKELLKLIYSRIQPILPFDSYGLFVLTEDGQNHYELLDSEIMQDDPAQIELERKFGAHHEFDHPGSAIEEFMLDGPGIYLIKDYFEYPQAQILYEQGLREIMGGPMIYGGEKFGMLCFISKTKRFYNESHLQLFNAISEQMSIATANVLASERLIDQTRFKEMLLNISQAVLTIQNERQLFRVILEHIRPVFPFSQVGLFLKEGKDYKFKMDTEIFPDSIFLKIPVDEKNQNLINQFVEQLIELDEPLITSPAELKKEYPGFPHEKQLTKSGNNSLILGGLKNREERLGLFGFASKEATYNKNDLRLFKAISDQLTIAISNILSKKRLELRERTKALEAALLKAMNEGETRKEKLEAIAWAFRKFIPADLIVFSPSPEIAEYSGFGFEQIGPRENRIIGPKEFQKISGISSKRYYDLLSHNYYDKIIRANRDAFKDLIKKDELRRQVAVNFSVQHALIIPLALSREGKVKHHFLFALYRKRGNGFTEEEEEMMHQILQSLVVGMERQIAYQEIKLLNQRLESEKEYLEDEIEGKYNFHEIVGSHPLMRQVYEKTNLVINTDTTTLILGETGTGKELIARALHNASNRKENNFIRVNCATLPKELVESELFGHEKGAFTGAQQQRIGKFELANKGTIFLDEIGELPLALQAKLLRVLQEKEFERLGGSKTLNTSARIIAATNRDLEQEVKEKRFRSDLYFRLSVFPILLPPLRERGDDIIELSNYFLKKYSKKIGKNIKAISSKDIIRLKSYSWPGNVRELEHIIERSVLLTKSNTLDLALEFKNQTTEANETFTPKTLIEAERHHILNTLKLCGGKVSGPEGAAEILDVPASTLEYRIKRVGIEKKHIVKRG